MPIINTNIASEVKSNDKSETSLRNLLKRKYPLTEDTTTTTTTTINSNGIDFQPNSIDQLSETRLSSTMPHNVQESNPITNMESEEEKNYLTNNESSFMNDVFNSDVNIISLNNTTASTANNVLSVDVLSAIGHSSPFVANSISPFFSPNVQSVENSDTWQNTSSDLLELDHRYNSNSQTSMETRDSNHCLAKGNVLQSKLFAEGNRACTVSKTRLNRSIHPRSQQMIVNQPLKHSTPIRHQRNISVSSSSSSSSSSSASIPSSNKTQRHCNEVPPIAQFIPYDSDSEDKSLAWLLNFKFDDFSQLGTTRVQQHHEQNGRATTSTTTTIATKSITTNNSLRQNNHTPSQSQMSLKANTDNCCLVPSKSQLSSTNKSCIRDLQLENAVNSILEQNTTGTTTSNEQQQQQNHQSFTTHSHQHLRKKHSKVGRKFAELVVEVTGSDNDFMCNNNTSVNAMTNSNMSDEILRMR